MGRAAKAYYQFLGIDHIKLKFQELNYHKLKWIPHGILPTENLTTMPKSLKEIQDKYNHSEKGIARSRRQAEKKKAERAIARQERIAQKAIKQLEDEAHWLAGAKHRDNYAAWLARQEEDKKARQLQLEPEETAFSKSQTAVLKKLLNKEA